MTENPAQKMVSYLELYSTVGRDGHEDRKARETLREQADVLQELAKR
ncbi:MAG: hypothetical protein GX486_07060 [Acetobacter sp.]|nr:hypothetical protein [Acetobacter sp.]